MSLRPAPTSSSLSAPEQRKRRSLTNVGGHATERGDPEASRLLAHALDVEPTEDADAIDRSHVHGFHAYPARAHPTTARRLVEAFAGPDANVFDPFCGSGTVLVEAMIAGRNAVGVDLNPFAVVLARAKTFPHSPEQSEALIEAARTAAALADERRKSKAGATRVLPQEDYDTFEPHVLLELDSLRMAIAEHAPPACRPELGLVLSAILVKLSRRKGDTSDEIVAKRISAGYPARLFVRKAEEAARRFDEFTRLLKTPPPRARVYQDDALVLGKVADASVDAVVTSPPYVATYDYLAHHALRLRWLGLDPRALTRHELGARRTFALLSAAESREKWRGDVQRLLRSLARVTKPSAPLVLLIADSAVGGRGEPPQALRADEAVAEAAVGTGFAPIAAASQERPHFHGPSARAFADRPRAEHALLLRRTSQRSR